MERLSADFALPLRSFELELALEVGGTVGDYENSFYLEACRQLAYEEGENSAMFVALTYVLEPGALGEQKSKAAQLGIKRLMEVGVMPHIIACRATNEVKESVKEKISMYTNVPMRRVVSMHDVESIYLIPESLRESGLSAVYGDARRPDTLIGAGIRHADTLIVSGPPSRSALISPSTWPSATLAEPPRSARSPSMCWTLSSSVKATERSPST